MWAILLHMLLGFVPDGVNWGAIWTRDVSELDPSQRRYNGKNGWFTNCIALNFDDHDSACLDDPSAHFSVWLGLWEVERSKRIESGQMILRGKPVLLFRKNAGQFFCFNWTIFRDQGSGPGWTFVITCPGVLSDIHRVSAQSRWTMLHGTIHSLPERKYLITNMRLSATEH